MASNPIVLKAWIEFPYFILPEVVPIELYCIILIPIYTKNKIFFLFFIYFIYFHLIYIFQNLKKCQLNIFDEL